MVPIVDWIMKNGLRWFSWFSETDNGYGTYKYIEGMMGKQNRDWHENCWCEYRRGEEQIHMEM